MPKRNALTRKRENVRINKLIMTPELHSMTTEDYKTWPVFSPTTRLLFCNLIKSFRNTKSGSTKLINMLSIRKTVLETMNALVNDKNRVLLISNSSMRCEDNVPVINIITHKGSKILPPIKLNHFITGGVRIISYGQGLLIITASGEPIYSISVRYSSQKRRSTILHFERQFLQLETLKPYLKHYSLVKKIQPVNYKDVVQKQTDYITYQTICPIRVMTNGKQYSHVKFPQLRDSQIFAPDQMPKYLTDIPRQYTLPITARVAVHNNLSNKLPSKIFIIYNRQKVYVIPSVYAAVDRHACFLELFNANLIMSGNYKPVYLGE